MAERFSAEGAVVALNHVNDGEAAAQAVAALHAASSTPAAHRVVTLSFEGSSSICVHLRVWRSDEAFPLISHGNNDAMDAWTQHSGPGS